MTAVCRVEGSPKVGNAEAEVRIDLTSPDHLRDPGKAIARFHAEGPIVRIRFPIIGSVWLATTHAACETVLKDTVNFGLRREGGAVAGLQWWMPGIFRSLASNMLTMDEPDHTRLRRIVDEAFRRRAVEDMTPRIREIAHNLADGLFDNGSPADAVGRYARRLPLYVICELLGLPAADRERFVSWAGRATGVTGVWSFIGMVPALSALKRYIAGQLAEAERNGGEGLIAELVAARRAGAQISDDEMIAMVFLLLFAGHETTTHLISGSLYELLRNPALRGWLEEDWTRAGTAVEEFLRYLSPVQFSKPRFVLHDTEIGGKRLVKGDKVMAFLAAAGRDPAVLERPSELDLARKPNRHLAFGAGIHFCLGHQLARIEGQIALEVLLDRWPALCLAVASDEVRWRRQPGIRALEALPVAPTA